MGITAFPFSSVIDVPTARILGRDDAGTGSAEALTNTEIFAILGTGTPSASTYLRGDGTWSTVSAGVGGSTGSVDNAVLRADGTGGATLQASGVTIDDSANITTAGVVQVGSATPATQYGQNGITNIAGGTRYDVIKFTAGQVILAINIVGFAYAGIQIERAGGLNTWTTINYSSSATGATGGSPRQTLDVRGNVIIDGSLQCHKGTTAVSAEVYNTYTSATSYERLEVGWATNVCTIQVTAGSAGGTLRGLRIGGAATSLLGFYGATPVDRPDTIADPAGGGTIDAEARTAINTIIDRLQELGLIA